MKKHLHILDLDDTGPEIVNIQYDTIIPEFHMVHVLDLASIVGTCHAAPRGTHITEHVLEYRMAFN